jgi:NAD(P)-dependent dehydrogenase (short-subunit alcohol dehydrogenase family)
VQSSSGKRVLITGASKGIGKALSIEYAKRGCEILLLARSVEEIENISAQINSSGATAYYKECDVTKHEDLKTAVDFAIEKMGAVDIAILNAGVSRRQNPESSFLNDYRFVFETNVFGILNGLDCLLPLMQKQGQGIIAGVGSLSDFRGLIGYGAYNSSKITVSTILESLRLEFKESGIRIVSIRPGFVRTPMTANNKFYMPFLMDADVAAKIIINGIENGKKRISFPLPLTFVSYLAKILPGAVYEGIISTFGKKYLGN